MPVVEGTADKAATQYPSGDKKQLGEALTHESVPVEPAAASRALRSLCSRRRMGSPSRDSSRSVARSFWAYFRISILRDIGGKVANFARVPELYAVVSSSSGSSCNSNRDNSRCSMMRRGLFGYPWAFIHSSKEFLGIPGTEYRPLGWCTVFGNGLLSADVMPWFCMLSRASTSSCAYLRPRLKYPSVSESSSL